MLEEASRKSLAPAVPEAPARARHALDVESIARGSLQRASLEAFIAHSFQRVYGATLTHFSDTLLGCRDGQGRWIAGVGYSLAANGALFLEQYLDGPIEAAIGDQLGRVVAREQIVEVGNLAAGHPGAARALIISMTRLLHAQGLRWVTFTATTSLVNSFARLRLRPGVLADADPRRLPDQGQHWGSYYHSQPQVMYGNIEYGYEQLS